MFIHEDFSAEVLEQLLWQYRRNSRENIHEKAWYQLIWNQTSSSWMSSWEFRVYFRGLFPIFFCCDNDTLFIVINLFIAKNWFNPLSVNPTKWSNTLKQFVGNLPTICLSVFYYFVKLTLKGLRSSLHGDVLEVSISIFFFTFGKLTWKLT